MLVEVRSFKVMKCYDKLYVLMSIFLIRGGKYLSTKDFNDSSRILLENY